MQLRLPQRTIRFPRRPLIMGIVNINDDSFCGDGTLDISAAMDQAQRMVAEGADLIDVGAESARTNRGPIPFEEEIARLTPFLQAWGEWAAAPRNAQVKWDEEQVWPPILSVNSWRPEVADAVLPCGVEILNDIGGLPDGRNAELCARHGAALIIMHSVGAPKVRHTHVEYADVWTAMEEYFAEKIQLACSAGLQAEQLIIDPGIDFAKQRDHNLAIYAQAQRLHRLGRPVLLPISRKTVIGQVLGLSNPNDRDAGTVACLVAGLRRGVHLFRVHNVRAAAQANKTCWAIEKQA